MLPDGPADYWTHARPPSSGQCETISRLACELLDLGEIRTRLDATVAAARIRMALDARADDAAPVDLPRPADLRALDPLTGRG